jgi:hypothetical protein
MRETGRKFWQRTIVFPQREKLNWHQIYSTKEFGKCLKIYSSNCGEKSQTIGRIVFLNETLFEGVLFHFETGQQ